MPSPFDPIDPRDEQKYASGRILEFPRTESPRTRSNDPAHPSSMKEQGQSPTQSIISDLAQRHDRHIVSVLEGPFRVEKTDWHLHC